MYRRVVLSVAGVLAAAVTAVVIVIAVAGGSQSSRGSGRTAASSTRAGSSVLITSNDVAAALRKLATTPEAVVADEAKRQLAGHTNDAVPPGSTVTPHTASWAPDGIGGGTMLVTVASPGQPTVDYAAVMVFEHNQWKVLATFPTRAAR